MPFRHYRINKQLVKSFTATIAMEVYVNPYFSQDSRRNTTQISFFFHSLVTVTSIWLPMFSLISLSDMDFQISYSNF